MEQGTNTITLMENDTNYIKHILIIMKSKITSQCPGLDDLHLSLQLQTASCKSQD